MGDADVRVAVVGAFSVTRAGRLLAPRQIGSRKARILLEVLAAQRGRLVSADTLVEAVWGESAPDNPAAGLATLVSRLRGVVGRDAIDGGRQGYRLVVGPKVALDVDEAERLVSDAEARLVADQPALALTAAQAALAIAGTGAVLDDEPGAEWAAEAGRTVARLVRRARAVAWQAADRLGDHRAALAAADDTVAADALDEEAQRAVILAYHRLGEPGEALAAYARLRSVLAEELGAGPGPATEALYEAVLRGEPVASGGAGTGAGDDRGAGAGVGPASGTPTGPGRGPAPGRSGFVGRDAELARVLACWAAATRGQAGCVLVTGEAGIGKSRLAAEVADDARAGGALVLSAACYQAERSLFLQPVVEVVRAPTARSSATSPVSSTDNSKPATHQPLDEP